MSGNAPQMKKQGKDKDRRCPSWKTSSAVWLRNGDVVKTQHKHYSRKIQDIMALDWLQYSTTEFHKTPRRSLKTEFYDAPFIRGRSSLEGGVHCKLKN